MQTALAYSSQLVLVYLYHQLCLCAVWYMITEEAIIRQQSRALIRVLTYISTYNNLETTIMKNRLKKIILTTGALFCLTAAPIAQTNPMGEYLNSMTTITAQAAEQNQLSYSTRWEVQQDGSWKYKLNTGGYASGWIQDEVDKNWYYMDSSCVMQSGVYRSYGKLYLLSEEHDGHFGHLVKNGEVYQGVTISASTNAEDEGALTEATVNALRNAGLNVDNVKDISGSQHVSDGVVTSNPDPAVQNQTSNTSGSSLFESNNGETNLLDKGGTGAEGRLH